MSSTSRAGALVLLLAVAGAAGVSPAQAAPKAAPNVVRGPVQEAVVTCVEPGGDLEFGGARVDLTVRVGRLGPDDFYVLVPVDDSTGLDAGERESVDRRQRTATVTIPADGRSLTAASTVEVRLGGDVLQRVPVAAGCGVVDPSPDRGPVLGAITSAAGTVTVVVENGSSVRDEIGVTLFPVAGSSGPTSFAVLEPGATGTVSFSGVAPGSYVVEAFGYASFLGTRSAAFVVG